MNTRKIKNLDLTPEVPGSGVIELYELSEENLKELGFMDENAWPSGDMLQVIDDLDTISPTEFGNGVKFWDQIEMGFSIYNQFLEDGEND